MTGFIDPLEMASAEPETDTAPPAGTPGGDPDTLERVRDLVLRAHPEVVPELVGGTSLASLLASIEPAERAFADLVTRLKPGDSAPAVASAAPPVPAGGSGPAPIDLERIHAAEKLRRGLRGRAAQPMR